MEMDFHVLAVNQMDQSRNDHLAVSFTKSVSSKEYNIAADVGRELPNNGLDASGPFDRQQQTPSGCKSRSFKWLPSSN
jgi:hypothetical protein